MAKTVYATGDIPTAANFNAFTQEANAAITGGTINGAAIGDSTPAAGSFTTLAASGGATITGAVSATTTGKVGTTLGVGNATPAASGAGITFPATQSASTDPNTLDDYEEGTWTPTVTYSTSNGDLSYTTQVGEYVKIGSVMHVFGALKFTESTASGVLKINLPVAVSALTGLTQGANCYADGLTGIAGGIQISITTNTTNANLYQGSTGTAVALTESNTGTDSVLRFSFSYFV